MLQIEEPELRNEMLVLQTEGLLIRKRKTFAGKNEIYNQIVSNLPEHYVLRPNKIEKAYALRNFDQGAVINLLQKEILSIDGEKAPLPENLKGYKLLKFWFAGCAPCKKQIPDENELLSTNENLSIIHFCKYTDQESWKEYIARNESKGSHFYISRERLADYKNVFSLTYSPRYILLNNDNEVICWDCANPSDVKLKELISNE